MLSELASDLFRALLTENVISFGSASRKILKFFPKGPKFQSGQWIDESNASSYLLSQGWLHRVTPNYLELKTIFAFNIML